MVASKAISRAFQGRPGEEGATRASVTDPMQRQKSRQQPEHQPQQGQQQRVQRAGSFDSDASSLSAYDMPTPRGSPFKRAEGPQPEAAWSASRAQSREPCSRETDGEMGHASLHAQGPCAAPSAAPRHPGDAPDGVGGGSSGSREALEAGQHNFQITMEGSAHVRVSDNDVMRSAFLHYCNSCLRPEDMHRLVDDETLQLSSQQFTAMAKDLQLIEPRGTSESGALC
eukprot:351378-Chlamydomonas_euryale.AAC.1